MKYILSVAGLLISISIWAQIPYLGNNDLWGVKDENGTVIVPCRYSRVSKSGYKEGLLGVISKNKWGFIDSKGNVVIPFRYFAISSAGFSEGLLACAKSNKWGYIDKSGQTVISSQFDYAMPFGEGVALVVKGKDIYFIDKAGIQVKELDVQNLADGHMFHNGQCIVGVSVGASVKYGVIDREGRWVIPAVYDEFCVEVSEPAFDANGIARVVVDGKTKYLHHNGTEFDTMSLALENIPEAMQETAIADNTHTVKDKRTPFKESTAPVKQEYKTRIPDPAPANTQKQKQDVLPQYRDDNENTFAVIIANEHYRRESTVEFALNDGRNFKEYCRLYLGIPQTNIHYIEDATLNDIRAEVNWLTRVAAAYKGKAKLIFYYAGHGIPDESSRTSYLLPADGFGSDVTTGYELQHLYDQLSSAPAEYAVAFLDACFSGGQRDGKMMESARGIAIKAKPGTPKGKLVVFSAAQEDETAYPYRDKGHGLFTYYLLQKIKEENGDVEFGELADYIIENVSMKSIVMNSKSQTPSVVSSPEFDRWSAVEL